MAESEPTQTTDPAPENDPTAMEAAPEEDDTEGHSMNYEYSRMMARERQQAGERAARDAARMGDRKASRSFLDRIRGR
jgi:hypothetical protein